MKCFIAISALALLANGAFANVCDGQADGTYLRDPEDCSRFYFCDEGRGVSTKCAGDLLWNTNINICDYPDNVDCGDRPSPTEAPEYPSTTDSTTHIPDETTVGWTDLTSEHPEVDTTTREAGFPTEIPNGTEGNSNNDRCKGLPDNTYLPDSTNCKKFYQCDYETAISQICPADLLFNHDLNVCDYAYNVRCGDRPHSSSDPEESSDAGLEPVEPEDPSDTEIVEPEETVEPEEAVEPEEPSEPSGSSEHTEPSQNTESSSGSEESEESSGSSENTEPAKNTESGSESDELESSEESSGERGDLDEWLIQELTHNGMKYLHKWLKVHGKHIHHKRLHYLIKKYGKHH